MRGRKKDMQFHYLKPLGPVIFQNSQSGFFCCFHRGNALCLYTPCWRSSSMWTTTTYSNTLTFLKFIPVQVKFCSFKKYLVRVKAFWVSQLQIKKLWPCRSQCKSRWAKFETGRAGTGENQRCQKTWSMHFQGQLPKAQTG